MRRRPVVDAGRRLWNASPTFLLRLSAAVRMLAPRWGHEPLSMSRMALRRVLVLASLGTLAVVVVVVLCPCLCLLPLFA